MQNRHYVSMGTVLRGNKADKPNPSEVAIADTWHGPFTVLPDPHPTDPSRTSFHSQVSSVFKVPGKKDLYIACADRWLPEHMDLEYDVYAREYAAQYGSDEHYKRSFTEKGTDPLGDIGANTSVADYVWLPLVFHDPSDQYPYGWVEIEWRDEWRIEDYE